MSDQQSQGTPGSPFEAIRHTTDAGAEYWSARELSRVLDYVQWCNFAGVIGAARTACELSGQAISDHFADTSNMIATGKGARRRVEDVHLSRYACYLIVQNADALGQGASATIEVSEKK